MIRTSRRDDTSTVWVQAPATVGVPLAAEGRIKLGGWVAARVTLLQSRPPRCYRCLAPDYVQQRCPCPTDRARCCFNCRVDGHVAAACRNRPHCSVCESRGRNVNHKAGSRLRARWPATGHQGAPCSLPYSRGRDWAKKGEADVRRRRTRRSCRGGREKMGPHRAPPRSARRGRRPVWSGPCPL